jgi:SAM-dependent methyltransferase
VPDLRTIGVRALKGAVSAARARSGGRATAPPPAPVPMDAPETLHAFWTQPSPPGNDPRSFIDKPSRSQVVSQLVQVPKDTSILEVGCGVGRNLAHLRDLGFTNLAGIEINPHAVELLRQTYPQLADVEIHLGAAEDVLPTLPDEAFEMVVTFAFLEHVSPQTRVFDEIVRVGRALLAVEATGRRSHRHHPYDYREEFTRRGLELTVERPLSRIPATVGDPGLAAYTAYRFFKPTNPAILHEFWRQPAPSGNDPRDYLKPTHRSAALLEMVKDLPKDARILEVGCNVGRNLAYLHDHGYTQVEGVEINAHAVELLREHHPQLADREIHLGTAEEVLPGFGDRSFDLVFTMAVLEHIHPDSVIVFDSMARIASEVLAIEPDPRRTHRTFPHDIPRLFVSRGMELVSATPMKDLVPPDVDATIQRFVGYRFRHRTS